MWVVDVHKFTNMFLCSLLDTITVCVFQLETYLHFDISKFRLKLHASDFRQN